MSWYTQGTVKVTKNSSTVTGSGTNWVENIRVGDGFNGPDGRMYQITNVASDTSMSIAPAYAGSSASEQSYGVVPVQGYLKKSADRLASVVNEIEDMPSDIAILQTSVTSINQSLDTKANNSTQMIAGTGLSGGGSLAANLTLSVNYGTTAGTAAQGNDSRITGAMQKSSNLSDLTNKTTARSNLGLGNVDNTSDSNKPISTATQTAIDAINTSLGTKTNTSTQIIAGTGLSGGGDLSTNRTLSVDYGTTSGTAAQGNDSRITGAMQKSSNLGDVANTTTARSNLGLGDAATRGVGTDSGNLMEVGAFGLGPRVMNDNSLATRFAYYAPATQPPGYSSGWYDYGVLWSIHHGYSGDVSEFIVSHTANPQFAFRPSRNYAWREIRHTGNTIVDGNGFIKNASPILRLYSDRIEDEGDFHQKPQLERVSKGVYKITGTLGLRIDDGWYLESPSDRNGNKYFNTDWEQDIEPENEEGVVDTPVEVVLTVRTYERVWNPQTGVHENGNPVDINEHQDRYVSLRFNELRQDEPEIPLGDDDVD